MRMQRAATGGDVRVGWKIGHGIEEIDVLGADLPVVGWLSTRTMLTEGETYSAHHARELRGETEIAVELRKAVEAEADDDAVRDAISGVRVALEIVDVARPPYDAQAIIVGNVFHRAVGFGTALGPLAGSLGRATLTIDGQVHHQGRKTPSPVSAVGDVAKLLGLCGARLTAGDRILTGSVVHVPVSPGDDLHAGIEGLGGVHALIGD
jgi:2-keto-4-pentenoate hydratase